MKNIYKVLFTMLGLTFLLPLLSNAQAKIVISQVYGGGGNSGATLRSDFIELFNAGNISQDISGWSVQYASSTGTSWQRTNLSGTIQPGQYYLIKQADGANTSATPLPAPDATGTIAMSATAGKVALVSNQTTLTSVSCPAGSAIIDFVGFGSATNCFEGIGGTATLSNTTAALRANNGCTDADNNSADFSTGSPNPRNTATPINLCFKPEPKVVVSQVYGGGGNTGATLRSDFIELFNAGTGPQDLTGWSVQYASSTGSSWQRTNLSGTIQPGQYYLVKQADGANTLATPLPVPDATGTIPMSGTAGKVALVSNQTNLTGTCPTGSTIIDFVGFGTATNCFEGSGGTATLSNTTAALRANDGCTDTDNNSADFSAGTPNPRNTASPFNICPLVFGIVTNSLPAAQVLVAYNAAIVASGGAAPVSYQLTGGSLPDGLTLGANGIISGTPTTNAGSPYSITVEATDGVGKKASKTFSLTVNPAPVCNPTHTIAQVQGSGLISPLLGSSVTVSGIVTGRKNNGYFVQMPEGDADNNTSDGIFVFTSSTPPLAAQLGNNVCITGTVVEFVSSNFPGGRSISELSNTTVFVTSTGNALPTPVVLTTAELNPNGGIDQLEPYEGMRVTVPSLTVAAPTQGNTSEANATATSNGFFYGVITGTPRPFREPGIQQPLTAPASAPVTVDRWDGNPELLGVASTAQPGNTAIDVATGAIVENLVGPLDFVSNYYIINVDGTTTATISNNNRTANMAPDADSDELTIASYNLERFFDTIDEPGIGDVVLTQSAYAGRLQKASLGIRNVMKMPDVIGVQEIENLGVLQAIAEKVNTDAVADGYDNPQYVAYLVEGNDPGGIDVGFLVKSSRIQVQSVVQYGKTATYTNPDNNQQEILNDRPPLVLEGVFLFPTQCQQPVPFIAITNHLRSLNGNESLTENRVRAKRLAQAEYLANLIQGFQEANPLARIISVGDYNAFQFNDGYVDIVGTVKGTPVDPSRVVLPSPTITDPPLTNLIDGITDESGYSYVFSGSAQTLDHVLVNNNLATSVTRFVPIHMNADFPAIVRNDFNRPERITDHDPQIAYFKFTPPPPPLCTISPILAEGAYTGGTPNQIFLGYGPQSVTLQATAVNGNSFTYQWSPSAGLSCTDCDAPVFTPTAPGLYTFTATITNDIGCSNTCEITICVTDVRVPGTNGNKIYICQSAEGNAGNKHTIEVSINAVATHLAKPGTSSLGTCEGGSCDEPASITKSNTKANRYAKNAQDGLQVQVAPNPSRNVFTLYISSTQPEHISLKVMDVSGKVLTNQSQIQPNSTISTGHGLTQGIYFAEVTQNHERVVLKLMKVN